MLKKNVAIYGLGEAGRQLLSSLNLDPRYEIVALFDDNPGLIGSEYSKLKVANSIDIEQSHKKLGFEVVLLALPSISRKRRREILDRLRPLKVGVRVLPSVHELFDCRVSVNSLLEFDAGDLLGRDEVTPNIDLLKKKITSKNILVTGAGGSIGRELCLEVLRHSPSLLVLLDHSEFALYEVFETCKSLEGTKVIPILGTVGSLEVVGGLLSKYEIQTVYHAAAYKHVPLVEENPISGLRNNVFGTYSLLQACRINKIETFVLISTDKSVRPTNIMGASKRIAEQLVQAFASEDQHTIYSMVRFGNVLDSNGSVVPLFRKQIKEKRQLTVTHKDVTRYFMSLGEAVRLVIQAGAMAKGGEVFVLDMGEPVKIYDLAMQMIELSGLVVEQDVSIDIIGLRPGEKLHEELLLGNNPQKTEHSRIYQAEEHYYSMNHMEYFLSELNDILSMHQDFNDIKLKELLARQVEEYLPSLD